MLTAPLYACGGPGAFPWLLSPLVNDPSPQLHLPRPSGWEGQRLGRERGKGRGRKASETKKTAAKAHKARERVAAPAGAKRWRGNDSGSRRRGHAAAAAAAAAAHKNNTAGKQAVTRRGVDATAGPAARGPLRTCPRSTRPGCSGAGRRRDCWGCGTFGAAPGCWRATRAPSLSHPRCSCAAPRRGCASCRRARGARGLVGVGRAGGRRGGVGARGLALLPELVFECETGNYHTFCPISAAGQCCVARHAAGPVPACWR
jgi:hypothetical protein